MATRLSFGDLVGSAAQYNQFQAAGTAFQNVTGMSYLGLRFLSESTGAMNYAWAEVRTLAGNGFPAAVLRYAYENAGDSITAGSVSAVPEPSIFAMFGLALAGAAGFDKVGRRQQSS